MATLDEVCPLSKHRPSLKTKFFIVLLMRLFYMSTSNVESVAPTNYNLQI